MTFRIHSTQSIGTFDTLLSFIMYSWYMYVQMRVWTPLFVLQFSEISYFAGLKEEDYDTKLTCVFWDPTLDDGFGNWSTEGCQLHIEASSKTFCECNHLTSFALLMVCTRRETVLHNCMMHWYDIVQDISPREVAPSPETFALEIITYIGLAVSILGLLFTIITYLVVKYVNACKNLTL